MKWFWNIVAILMMIALFILTMLIVSGCEPVTPSPPSRYTSAIKVMMRGTHRPDSIMGFDFCVKVLTHGDVPVSGRRIAINTHSRGRWSTGWWTPIVEGEVDPFTIERLATIGRNGSGRVSIKCAWEPIGYWMDGGCGIQFYATDNRCTSSNAGAFFQSQYSPYDGGHLPAMHWDTSWPGYFGAYWRSYQFAYDGSEGDDGINPEPIGTMGFPLLGPDPNVIWPSMAEQAFLQDTSIMVNRGFKVHSQQWLVKRETEAVPATYLFPVNHCEKDIIAEHALPYYLSYMIVVAEPINLQGRTFSAKIICEAFPDGIPIDIEIRGVSPCFKRFYAHTDFIIPIESDQYAPEDGEYTIFGKRAVLVPVRENEQITVFVEIAHQSLFTLADLWLTDSRTADITQDGIVNLRDMGLFLDPAIWSDPNSFLNDPNYL